MAPSRLLPVQPLLALLVAIATLSTLSSSVTSQEGLEPSPSPPADAGGNGEAPSPTSHLPQAPSQHIHSPSSTPRPSLAEESSAPGPSQIPTSSPGIPSSPSSDISPSAEPPGEEDTGEDNGPSDLNSNTTVTWCAVRDEYTDCQNFMTLLHGGSYNWTCVRKQSAMDCMEAIKEKKADLMSLDAGLAYIAFTNYSMKVVMAEEYCYHAKSYNAVAVVNKDMCDKNSKLSMRDFRGLRSCHPGYRTAAGWNYPVQYLVANGLQRPVLSETLKMDEAVVTSFFSETCAPSEFDGTGLCSSCGNNGTCDPLMSSKYTGYSGALRCLMEGVGDIAFLRPDTTVRLSSDGLNAQNWSTKSVNDFMYLCPGGGCRPINDNIGSCSFGAVPANVIMTFNSQRHEKRTAIVNTLLNASWADALYSGHNWNDHILSASAQNVFEVVQLTRSYLGDSGTVAQSVQALQNTNVSALPNSAGFHLGGFSYSIIIVLATATLHWLA